MRKKKNKGETQTIFEKAVSKAGWGLYSAKVAVLSKFPKKQKQAKIENRRLKNGVFVYLMLLLPLIQFGIFYIGVNFNSIIMTFQQYDGYKYSWAGFANFKWVWTDFIKLDVFGQVVKNSLLSFLIVQLMSPIVLFFTFFIYKKFPGYRFFKIVLFLPTIISTLITVTVFRTFCEDIIPAALRAVFGYTMSGGLLSNPKTTFGAIMFFYMWLSFGTLMLMYLGCMNGISDSVVESAKLEGANSMQEFFYITFPMIYPTFATLFYTSIATIFTNQINLFSFYGAGADSSLWTFGYYLYKEVQSGSDTVYPHLATMGLLMTLIAAPLTFFFKWLLNKIGPSAE